MSCKKKKSNSVAFDNAFSIKREQLNFVKNNDENFSVKTFTHRYEFSRFLCELTKVNDQLFRKGLCELHSIASLISAYSSIFGL